MKRILIIDDDTDMCQLLSHFLQRKGFETDIAHTCNKGLQKFKEREFDVVLCDFRLGDWDGRKVLVELKKINPDVVVIIITGYSDIKMAVEVMRHGAYDYITKPLIPDEVIAVINKSLQDSGSLPTSQSNGTASSANTVASTYKGIADNDEFLVGISACTVEMYKQTELISPTNFSVILYGESGTGKEVIAKTIHQSSNRKNKPFVAVDCGTISRELAASELFGHIKGSFTGAIADKEGFFEVAEGGTLFLDEVSNLPLDVQATLLRVIQERKFKRVGSSKDMMTDVRVIVASNENLQDAYRKGKFREDLYHRFNEFSITIPPLRQRKEDIMLFSAFFLKKIATELNKQLDGFDDEVTSLFLQYDWPGNLRELRNVIRRGGLLSTSGKVNSNVLPWEIIGGITTAPVSAPSNNPSSTITFAPPKDLKETASQAEYQAIMNVLKEVKFNKTKAAARLHIDRKTLYNKIKYFEDNNNIE
ncbi:MAG: sigma-54 dependent transcriptional regulator [Chitinophagaceae bacterium]